VRARPAGWCCGRASDGGARPATAAHGVARPPTEHGTARAVTMTRCRNGYSDAPACVTARPHGRLLPGSVAEARPPAHGRREESPLPAAVAQEEVSVYGVGLPTLCDPLRQELPHRRQRVAHPPRLERPLLRAPFITHGTTRYRPALATALTAAHTLAGAPPLPGGLAGCTEPPSGTDRKHGSYDSVESGAQR
jgi:hypothetical protein